MKTNRILSFLAVCGLCVTLLSCEKDNGGSGSSTTGGKTTSDFTVTPSGLTSVSSTGGTGTITIKTTGTPTVSSDQSWCTTKQKSKNSLGYVYDVTVAASNETNDRTATITVTVGSSSKTVMVTQLSTDGLVISSDKNVSVKAAGETITVSLSANGDFDVNIGAGWITAVETKANMTSQTRTFKVSKNPVAKERSTTISFTLNNITEAVTVTQEAGDGSSMSKSAMDLAKEMYPGWNLGNTLEAGISGNLYTNNGGLGAETYWQGTKTTQAIIDFVASQGFKSVRIPCAWMMGHISNASSYTIDSNWMSRVRDVVDYCISKDLYVILNDHWDGGWVQESFSDISDATVTANCEKMKTLWTQIATTFKDYDEHLLFAGLNEPGMDGDGFTEARTEALIKYEQAFIDAVRSTEGNNGARILVVQGPETDIDKSYNLYDPSKLSDWVEDRLMVEVHFYSPWQFCGLTEDASWGKMWYYWGSGNNGSDSSRNTDSKYTQSYVKSQMAKMKTKYYDKGYPVVLGEYGANYRFTGDSKHNASIKAFYKAVNQYAVASGCIPYAWDTNYTGYPSMTIIDRANLSIFNSYMMEGVTEGVAAASWPN